MTFTSWPSGVNTKFFGYQRKHMDNTVMTEFDSGRKAGFKKNTKNTFSITCTLCLSKKTTELALFWSWYDNHLGGKTGVFTCPALGDRYYRFSEDPEPQDTNQTEETLSLSIEEVY